MLGKQKYTTATLTAYQDSSGTVCVAMAHSGFLGNRAKENVPSVQRFLPAQQECFPSPLPLMPQKILWQEWNRRCFCFKCQRNEQKSQSGCYYCWKCNCRYHCGCDFRVISVSYTYSQLAGGGAGGGVAQQTMQSGMMLANVALCPDWLYSSEVFLCMFGWMLPCYVQGLV